MMPEHARGWLCEQAFPMWLEHGVDWKAGAFFEDIDPETLQPRAKFRRLRVVARQIYSFAQAARLGVPRAEDAVELGLGFLRHHARQPDGGYAMRFGLDNRVIDDTRDLYDHAFVLLAFAAAGRREAARDVLATIDTTLAHPDGGWRESLPDALPRRQNPHMHLLEAVLAAAETFAEPIYLDRADAIVDLFLDRFFQAESGTLPEYYDHALVVQRTNDRFVFEPGHHHEWVWLLDEHRRIAAGAGRVPRDTRSAAEALMQTAERHGVDSAGLIVAELWSDFSVKQAATRVWPHTERLKALSRSASEASAIPSGLDSLFRFMDDVPAGLWRDRWDGGFVMGESTPASSLYHITCAILEASGPA